MPEPKSPVQDIHSEEFLQNLMRKQLRLSISCGLAFIAILLLLPLANYFFPEQMAMDFFGFTLTWFLLGVAAFPFVWVISAIFIRRSMALEKEEARMAGKSES
jgi:uncharacterized membrane protein (DUF485 family)